MPGPEALYSCRGQASPKGRAISLALLVPFLGDRPAEVGALCLSSASFAYGQVIYLHPIPLLFFPQEDADFCPLLCRSPCLCSPPWVMTEETTEEACHQQGTCLGGLPVTWPESPRCLHQSQAEPGPPNTGFRGPTLGPGPWRMKMALSGPADEL